MEVIINRVCCTQEQLVRRRTGRAHPITSVHFTTYGMVSQSCQYFPPRQRQSANNPGGLGKLGM